MKQKVVSLSTIEEEYHGAIDDGIKVVWISHLFRELCIPINALVVIPPDNKS